MDISSIPTTDTGLCHGGAAPGPGTACPGPGAGAAGITLVDTTLRDGAQAPGVVFSNPDREAIAEALSEAGVAELEAGIPAMGDEAVASIRALVRMDLHADLISWCRAVSGDLEAAARTGTRAVSISFPTSSILLDTFGRDEAWVLKTLPVLVRTALADFDRIYVGAQDATRTRPGFLDQVAALCAAEGVHRLRIADTVGIARPLSTAGLIHRLRAVAPGIGLEFHAHNDLGMATANAVCAAEAGAEALSVTVNGLGERAGNACLEEVGVALFGTGSFRGGLRLDHLRGICELVARLSCRPIHRTKPVTGSDVFRHESGIHCMGMLRNPSSYQPFSPDTVGSGPHELGVGLQSGTAILKHILAGSGITPSETELPGLLARVRQKAMATRCSLSRKEVLELYCRAIA